MALRTKRPTAAIRRTIELPIEVNDKYEERAIKSGRSVEDVLERTAAACADYNAQHPIYLDDNDRNTLTLMSGNAVRTPEDVVKLVNDLLTIRVGGIDIALHHQLLKRLESRRFGSTMKEMIQRVVVEQLEQFVGLR